MPSLLLAGIANIISPIVAAVAVMAALEGSVPAFYVAFQLLCAAALLQLLVTIALDLFETR